VLKPFTVLGLAVLLSSAALAADEWTGKIVFRDGKIEPREIIVPANTRLVLELVNQGTSPAEFESRELSKEKVLAPNSTSSLVIRRLDAGRYEFVDDFHPDAAPAVLIAQ
jgi:hypothetical protein